MRRINLRGKNDKLSQDVHENESKVQNINAKVSAAYEELKQKSKDLCLLESKLLELKTAQRNKTKKVEKVEKLAERRNFLN